VNQKLKYAPDMERIAREQKIKRVATDLTLAAVVVAIWGGLTYFAITQWLGSAP